MVEALKEQIIEAYEEARYYSVASYFAETLVLY
jgi:hypothetical protein